MRKLTTVSLATLFLLFTIALPARSDESTTEGSGTVSSSNIAGLPTNAQVRVNWEPVVGQEARIENVTTGAEARCTVAVGTLAAPSTLVRCVVTQSDIVQIGVGNTVQVQAIFLFGTRLIQVINLSLGRLSNVEIAELRAK